MGVGHRELCVLVERGQELGALRSQFCEPIK